MSDLRLTFTDPATRRTVTLDAQRAPQTPQENDGFVDLGLDGLTVLYVFPRPTLIKPKLPRSNAHSPTLT